jgi:hypothetical protein
MYDYRLIINQYPEGEQVNANYVLKHFSFSHVTVLLSFTESSSKRLILPTVSDCSFSLNTPVHDCIGGEIVSVLASSVVDRGF